ncbi:hypothetical protein FGO68_gene14901 [Halteria grandinella]|uniref:Uncharacterized protein n=1 Tax=Halteria grandinella TaxID=5974 RepID=A0A8J8NBE6_HALGN|nr:hypothetical protein FGO68_gene14901 [Halteria grandinella]
MQAIAKIDEHTQHASQLQQTPNTQIPQIPMQPFFRYDLYQDRYPSGRLDVTVQMEGSSEGVVIHSKKRGDKFPESDMRRFLERLDKAMGKQ